MDDIKNCENCKNYLRHYVKFENETKFIGGYCVKRKNGLAGDCKNWEQSGAKPNYDEYESLRANLRFLSDNLKSVLDSLNK